MPPIGKRVLAIGVGGSGKAALTILKERLEETYDGQVPENVVLLELDTDDLRESDTFAGTRLNGVIDSSGREPEFQHVVSKPGVTMDSIFADMQRANFAHYNWLEREKLSKILAPAERDIKGGAQQRRPIGRVAFFQRWDNPVATSIKQAITRVYGEPEMAPLEGARREQSKRLIFIVGSVAGGTGSGMIMDVVNITRHIVRQNQNWQSIDVAAIIVLPDAFKAYAKDMKDITNLRPNSYAALRELDRFTRVHDQYLPYMIGYDNTLNGITWSMEQPLDQVYLVDTTSPSTMGESDLSTVPPTQGVYPLISDFIMAHIDRSLGDLIATNRSNAGQYYDKVQGWQYSSFNVYNYIFPADDVIESFSYRFLREMITTMYLPVRDPKRQAMVDAEGGKRAEMLFAQNTIGEKTNPVVVQKSLTCTTSVNPEPIDSSWPGLFNLIALSDSAFTTDYQDLQKWMDYMRGSLVPTGEGDYKKESYEDGFNRLRGFSQHFMDECLGKQYDPDNEDARQGGQFDLILGRYLDALRLRFAEALDVAIRDTLNLRDPNSQKLLPNRLPETRAMLATLKARLVAFKARLDTEYITQQVDAMVLSSGEMVRSDIAWMSDTMGMRPPLLPWPKSKALLAQESYIQHFTDKMNWMLHQRIFKVVLEIVESLGAKEVDNRGSRSVLDHAMIELENWEATFKEVDKILYKRNASHTKDRETKASIRVRRYLTSPEFEDELYKRPEHKQAADMRTRGIVGGEMGTEWQRAEETVPLSFKLVSTWAQQARGAEAIANEFFVGAKKMFRVVRDNVTITDRIASEFKSYQGFVNQATQIKEPFLRYSPATNEQQLGQEHYISFNNTQTATEEAQMFMQRSGDLLGSSGVGIDNTAESRVSCTVLEISRGVKMAAVDQFQACEPDYRLKIYKGKESLHLFREEQMATIYEDRIALLNEDDNFIRPLAPEVVICMGDENTLKAYVLACAYGLVSQGTYTNPKDGSQTNELFFQYTANGEPKRIVLSESTKVQKMDNTYAAVAMNGKIARLYLNAMQNFVLKGVAKPGIPTGQVPMLRNQLSGRADMEVIPLSFTISLKDIYDSINTAATLLGPSEAEVPEELLRKKQNAQRRAAKLTEFVKEMVCMFKANSDTPRIKDMGTVMHLILRDEIEVQKSLA